MYLATWHTENRCSCEHIDTVYKSCDLYGRKNLFNATSHTRQAEMPHEIKIYHLGFEMTQTYNIIKTLRYTN